MIQVINKVLDYIEEFIQDDIKLEDISKFAYYSSWHISRWFNHYVGISFNEYINMRRLSLAALMIKDTNKPIEFVAYYYGYNSSKYFSNLFKMHFNISPREFRSKNYFIDLQIKRELKGDKSMKILKLEDLVREIIQNSHNQNELLDMIGMIDNCVLYEQMDSELKLIAFCLNDVEEYLLIEVDINLMNGKYLDKLIVKFKSRNDIIINSIYNEDETVFIEFKSLLTNKKILAKLIEREETKIDFSTNILTDIDHDYEINNIEEIYNFVKLTAESLSKLNHVFEIEDYIIKEHYLLKMRGFGKEFVFLKLVVDNNNLFVFSIYLNYHEENIIQQIKQIYYANKGNKKVDFVLEKNKACIYLDGELHSQSFINIGSDVPPKFIISFPNGLTGRGSWDISGMFR